MRLSLTVPGAEPAPLAAPQGSRTILVGTEEVRLVWGRLVPYPDDVARWRSRVIAVEVPPEARVDVLGFESRPTRAGWPCDVITAVVMRDERPVQHRLVACFHFLEYGGVALAAAPTQDALDRARDVLHATFASGRPDWAADGTVICLRDLLASRSR